MQIKCQICELNLRYIKTVKGAVVTVCGVFMKREFTSKPDLAVLMTRVFEYSINLQQKTILKRYPKYFDLLAGSRGVWGRETSLNQLRPSSTI